MNPIDWLNQNALGFRELTQEERDAIMAFSLLWSFFETKLLQTNASANKILSLVHRWESNGKLNADRFAPSLNYFCDRYFRNGTKTEFFNGLNLRRNDNPDLVRAVLAREDSNPVNCIAVLLIVVLRLRNNLFHGVKWAYGIRGQLTNFTNANAVLMAALEIEGV
jgi:hypothetical protein